MNYRFVMTLGFACGARACFPDGGVPSRLNAPCPLQVPEKTCLTKFRGRRAGTYFDGYTDVKEGMGEQPIMVVLADVRCGKSASPTCGQRKIKEAVEQNRVKWETITLLEGSKNEQGECKRGS